MSKAEQELVARVVARMSDLTEELEHLNEVLERFRVTIVDVALKAEVERDTQRAMMASRQVQRTMRFLSGRWPLRDGDHFVNVSAPEPKHADDPDPTGDK